ncbi:MAG TPA: hypothetical protein VHP38_00455, partial [Ruminiclostridium sp.]|nr:hypothetical protein [Ruminiclostridium sp.]
MEQRIVRPVPPGFCLANVLSVLPGPTSRRITSFCSISLDMPFPNITASLMCLAQYPGSVASSALIHSPVR